MERLNAAREAANGDMSVEIEPLKPKDERILTTKIIAENHKRLTESQT